MTNIPFLGEIRRTLGGGPLAPGQIEVTGAGALPSAFAVTDLAAATVAAAGLAAADLVALRHARPAVRVDRRLASMWFAWSLRPDGWQVPPPWDPIAGDYRADGGWIRLHTNAPHHRAAALAVLDCAPRREAVAEAVAGWKADALEAAVVARQGCAAAMRSLADWAAHPQGVAVAIEPLVARAETDEGPAPGWTIPRDRPLGGLRVLDLTRVLAGPVATRFLAGLGADVLRIDPPDWDEPAVVPEVTLGKRCARLDLRDAAGRATFERLLAGADVLVHGYRPGALDGLGFDANRRRALRPGLVEVALDAYGWSGPWRNRRGFDSLVQMSAGIAEAGMRASGRDRPTPLPVQALDHGCGYLAAAAALRGLAERWQTGRGSTARLSLARTAALLAGGPAGQIDATLANGTLADTTLADETADDRAPGIEATAWGPARRLVPPVVLDGTPLRWPLPAGPLGAAPASWS